MKVELLHYTPLFIASKSIRKCWASEGKSDTDLRLVATGEQECGEKDKELMYRVGNKFKHSSTLEHINYSFDIDGCSRACLQELARHRHQSLSVKSTRYTLGELKTQEEFILKNVKNSDTMKRAEKFLVFTGDYLVDCTSVIALENLRVTLVNGKSNDIAKYNIPESYRTSLVSTMNMRSLQNFLSLRTDKSALWEIQELAHKMFEVLPDEHKFMLEDFVKDNK